MKKFVKIFFSILLCISIGGTVSRASDDSSVSRIKTIDEIKNHITTTVTIQDTVTGEITSYELEKENMQVYIGTAENPEITVVVSSGENNLTRDPSQSNSNTFYGWKGNVRITWYDDGTYARLTSAGGDWTRISGSYAMTDKRITYGQSLGTNSRSGSSTFINSYNVAPGWPAGKYGKDHFLGANISGTVNNQYVNIICNYTLW